MIRVTDNGTTWSFRPLDADGKAFIASLGTEGWQFLGSTLVVDHRMGRDMVERFSDEMEFVQ